jgi:hypothetical protein
VLTDNGIQLPNRKRERSASQHLFDRVCQEDGSDQRRTKTHHPWTTGPVARMNRALKDAPVKQYDYQTHHHLKDHLHAFLMADNFAKRLQTLKGLTPYESIAQCWHKEPARFTMNPSHHTLGLNA